jgi:type VI secretion system secreted protein Hcp
MLKKLVCSLVGMLLLLTASSADAALNAYLKVKGQKSGWIVGGVTQRGREGSSLVVASSQEIIAPRDAASGLPSGKRMYKPLTVILEVDKALPRYINAIATNETLPEVELRYWRPVEKVSQGSSGTEVQFYTIKLTNAGLASIRYVQPNGLVPEQRQMTEYVELQFTFQKIEWTWTDGGITASDDWIPRV